MSSCDENLMRPPVVLSTEHKKLDPLPFTVAFLAVFAFALAAIIYKQDFVGIMDAMTGWVNYNFGWAYTFLSLLLILFAFGIVVSPIGSIRIGGPRAMPAFGVKKWFAISLCSGIGIGILFWGIGEPIFHFMQPAQNVNVAPGSHEASLFAISQGVLHWSIAQYCIYTMCGVAFALASFNEKRPLNIMSALQPVLPAWGQGSVVKDIIHACCLFSICCTVISSIGALIMMVSSSVSYLTGLPRGFALNAAVALFATAFFVTSSSLGLKRGMAFLSTQNTRLFFILLFFVFFCGPTNYILNMGSEACGYMLDHFFQHSTLSNNPFLADHWANNWIIPYMGCFFAYAPPIGLYLARLGRGRTVRQFILMNVLAPSVFVYFWINTFGSLAIFYQRTGVVDVWNFVQTQGLESTVISILQGFPLHGIVIAVFVVVTVISFVTLVDPMTSVLATISTRGISAEDEAPRVLKVAWGFNMGAVALAVVTLCGVAALRGMFTISGVFILLIDIGIYYSVVRMGMDILERRRQRRQPPSPVTRVGGSHLGERRPVTIRPTLSGR